MEKASHFGRKLLGEREKEGKGEISFSLHFLVKLRSSFFVSPHVQVEFLGMMGEGEESVSMSFRALLCV